MKKVLALFMGCSLLFMGCRHDDVLENDPNQSHEENGLKGKSFVLTQTELEAKYAGNKSLNNILQKEFKAEDGSIKTNSDGENGNGVYIDLDHVQVFESNQIHAITYYVEIGKQEETEEPLEMYNLMYFSYDNKNYYAILYHYNFSQISLKQFLIQPEHTLNVVGFVPLNDIENIYENIAFSIANGLIKGKGAGGGAGYQNVMTLQPIKDDDCSKRVDVPAVPCKGDGHMPGETCYLSGSDRAIPGYTYFDNSDCYDFSGHGPGPGGGGGGGGTTNPEPNPETTIPIIKLPVNHIKFTGDLTVLPGVFMQINIKPKEANAKFINKMDTNQDFLNKMSELENASTFGYESAYSLYNNAISGLQFSPKYTANLNGQNAGKEVELIINVSSTLTPTNCIGFAHCHTTDGSTYKTFSFSDIFMFSQLAYFSSQSTDQLGVYLTTQNGGTYVMKMTSKIKMRGLYMKLLVPQDYNELDKKLDRNIDKVNQTAEQQTLILLQFLQKELKDMGLEIYEKNSSGKWERLTLSSNKKSIIRTDINSLEKKL